MPSAEDVEARLQEEVSDEELQLMQRNEPLHAASRRRVVQICAQKRCVAAAVMAATALLAVTAMVYGHWPGAGASPATDDLAVDLQGKAVTWMPLRDAKTGKTYYYSPQLQKTTWQLPATAAVAAVPTTTTKPLPAMPTTIGSCGGSLEVPGLGAVSLVNAKYNTAGTAAGNVQVANGRITARMGGRSYWAGSCAVGNNFDQYKYAGVQLLGKTMKWTVDLTGLECGCNVALYMTSLRENTKPSYCQDFYCDAGNVCGVSCDEVDLMEANKHAWFSTMHMDGDKNGAHIGYGHFVYDWNSTVYGPGAACIDTNKPISVAVSFPTDESGALAAMSVELSQPGSPCPLSATLADYGTGMAKISAAMAKGMTPILSYWSSRDMMWMDGVGVDGRGPCRQDTPAQCASSASIYGLSVESVPATYTQTV